ncbi:MAG TPA: hypothetical protein VKA51_02345 [Rubrobacteraceae bacterium]|nr:hypothetical protein [Rubrobacteraceae bacterium]
MARLAEHFGEDPRGLPIVSERLSKMEHPNVQAAFEAWVAGEGRSSELVGVAAEQKRYAGLSLSDLVAPAGHGLLGPRPGRVDYVNVAVGVEGRAGVEHGLYLLREGEEALTALVSVPGEFGGAPPINIEVTAPKPGTAARFLAEIRENMRRHNVYRG